MRKIKLITSLSALSSLTAVTPIVATSCEDKNKEITLTAYDQDKVTAINVEKEIELILKEGDKEKKIASIDKAESEDSNIFTTDIVDNKLNIKGVAVGKANLEVEVSHTDGNKISTTLKIEVTENNEANGYLKFTDIDTLEEYSKDGDGPKVHYFSSLSEQKAVHPCNYGEIADLMTNYVNAGMFSDDMAFWALDALENFSIGSTLLSKIMFGDNYENLVDIIITWHTCKNRILATMAYNSNVLTPIEGVSGEVSVTWTYKYIKNDTHALTLLDASQRSDNEIIDTKLQEYIIGWVHNGGISEMSISEDNEEYTFVYYERNTLNPKHSTMVMIPVKAFNGNVIFHPNTQSITAEGTISTGGTTPISNNGTYTAYDGAKVNFTLSPADKWYADHFELAYFDGDLNLPWEYNYITLNNTKSGKYTSCTLNISATADIPANGIKTIIIAYNKDNTPISDFTFTLKK